VAVEVLRPIAPPPQRRWLARAGRTAALVAVAAVAGAAAALGVSFVLDEEPTPPGVTVVERVETRVVAPEDGLSVVAAVARQVLPSIVSIEVSLETGDAFVINGRGSGVVYDTAGHLVTNAHVVADGRQFRAVFADGRTYVATLVGADPLTDVAVLRIDAFGLTPIAIGSAQQSSIGDLAIAIGNPLGLEGGPSVTTGVLSAFDRRIVTSAESELFGMLQTDAPITRGSSGGALVDEAGRLLGITTAFGVSDVGQEGLGFAVPVELVVRVADDLIADGVASHTFLGISGSTRFEVLADGALAPAGVRVAEVIDGTAADLGGIVGGDVILSVDGQAVSTLDGLVIRLRVFRVGDSVTIAILRGSEPLELPVTLLERPADL
jgi:S1-C subfamily serine protease